MKQISRKKAKAFGLKVFYTGLKCKYGHLSNRYVSTGACVECSLIHGKIKRNRVESNRAYYSKNTEKCDKANRDRYYKRIKEDPEREKEKRKEVRIRYKQAHPDRVKKNLKEWKEKNKLHMALYAALKRRRIRNATPPWADKTLIREKYIEAIEKTRETGTKYVVDHIIPLTHDKVCGLHIHTNLQVITEKENLAKYNKFSIKERI